MTWNPNDKTSKIILSEADLKVELTTGNGNGSVRSRYGLSSGKWYLEIYYSNRAHSNQFLGFSNLSRSLGSYTGNDTNSWGFELINTQFGTGSCRAYHNGSYVEHSDRVSGNLGAYVRMALDLDNKKVWWSTSQFGWDGDPTDPVSGDWALEFSGNTDTLYIEYFGTRGTNGFTVGKARFTGEDQEFSPPTGYIPIAEGWPVSYVFESGLFTLTGQVTEQTGGYLPVYIETNPAEFGFSGGVFSADSGRFSSTNIQLKHDKSSNRLILRRSGLGRVLNAYTDPNHSLEGSSGYLDQTFVSGKWYLEFSYTSLVPGNPNSHPSENVMCGITRIPNDLDRMTTEADNYMVAFGAFGEATKVFREDFQLYSYPSSIQHNHKKGLALDLTDPLNGKFWVNHNGSWLNGDPVSGTGGIDGLKSGWYFSVSVKGLYQINLGGTDHLPVGFTNIASSSYFSNTGMSGFTFSDTTTIGTMELLSIDLIRSIGDHLLRSSTWNKRSTYYLGLLTSMNPIAEVNYPGNEIGYSRQIINVSDSAWNANFESLSKISFRPFDATVVGWAFYIRPTSPFITYDYDPVVFARALPSPITVSSLQPGIAFPVGAFTWGID